MLLQLICYQVFNFNIIKTLDKIEICTIEESFEYEWDSKRQCNAI